MFIPNATPMHEGAIHASLEVCFDTPILYAINAKFENQPSTLDFHMKFEIQIIELDAFGRCQASEQPLGYRVQVCSERADADEVFRIRIWRNIVFACDQFVFHA